jgi:tetratricopeptide (TPR) repeat protein
MAWAIVGAVIGALTVLGVLALRHERQSAAAKLLDATAAFQRGDLAGALALLKDALWVPLDNKYGAADARTAQAAVSLLEDVLRKMGADPTPLTQVLKGELAAASAQGGAIARAVTDPVARFLDGDRDQWLPRALERKAVGGDARPQPPAGGDAMSADEQGKVLDAIGKSLGAGKLDDAVAAIDAALGRATGDFRAALLGRRADACACKQDLATAAADHAEAAKLQPSDPLHVANLAASLERLGQAPDALAAAKQALELNPTGAVRELADGVVRRLTALGQT